MFPGPHAQIYRNEAGEPIGWDYPSYDESGMDPYEEEEYWRRRDPKCEECGAPAYDCDCEEEEYTDEDRAADRADAEYHYRKENPREEREEDWDAIREAEDASDRHWDGL